MTNTLVLISVFLAFLGRPLWRAINAEKSCGHFDFTEADGSVYTAVENTTGVIPFQVTNITCNGNFPFVVGFKLPNDKKVDDDCIIFLNSTDKHPCLNISRTGEYHYELRKTFDRSDNGVMIVLSAVDGTIQTRNITLDIHYPARVTSLNITQSTDLTDQPVEPNSTITVACSWETGNTGKPVTTALLLDRNRTKMASDQGGSGQLQYTVDSVSCDDAGNIYCEAPGASENRTATLLVKCPPKFAETVFKRSLNPSDTESTISLDFRAHTGDIEECRIKNLESSSTNGLDEDCLSLINVTGTPPDLMLTVRLDNVRKQDEGQWTLTLTNDAGNGSVQFTRKFIESTTSNDDSTTESSDNNGFDGSSAGDSSSATTAAISAVLAVLGSVVLSVFVIYRLRRQIADKGMMSEQKDVMITLMHMQNGLLDDLGERRVFVNKVLHEGLGHQDGAAAPLYANEAACSSSPLRSTAANLLGTRESGGGSEYDDYAEVCDKDEKTNTVQKKLPRARNSRRIPAIADEEDDDYAEVDGDVGKKPPDRGKQVQSVQFCDMRRTKATSDDDTYVDIADIRKRKAEKREQRLVVLEGATAADEDTYVPISEILDRKKQAKNTAPKDESNKDDLTRPVS